MRRFALFLISTIMLFCAPIAKGAYFDNIPFSLTSVDLSDINSNFQISPSSKTVKVGIGNQTFSSYTHNKTSIYGTGEFEVYNNNTYIDTYDSNNVINVSMVGKIFVLSDRDNNVIAKVSGPVRFKADFGFLGIKDLKRAGRDAVYRGEINLVCAKESAFYIINNLEVEDYLKGVVPNEMPVSFGLEALKAQAVAARNYVLSPRVKANPNYDVVDSVASQVYFGANTEKSLSNQAIDETRGIVALYNWDLILALYSSSAGGYTENYENAFSDPITKAFPAKPKPYLKAKPDYDEYGILNTDETAEKFYKSRPKSFDEKTSYFRWEREWTHDELQKEIQDHIAAQSAAGFVKPVVNKGEVIGNITGINVLKRGFSGKIMNLEIQTDSANYVVSKELVIRRLFTVKGKALPSANFVLEEEKDENGNLQKLKIYGGGFGHGVGLSQYGAGYMGTHLNKSFEQILEHYYTDITLGTKPIILSSAPHQKTKTQTFFTKNGKGTLVVDNKYGVEYIDTTINGVFEAIKLNKNTRFNRIDFSPYLQKGVNQVTFTYPKNTGGIRLYIEIAGKNEFSD
ncbi:MAG: SpoIID/LytB domain-containing protein [Cyanobacteriota bacterium]|nr:SpoIID/LytB domain-containing protein [Cyanobacteriota bacterium]